MFIKNLYRILRKYFLTGLIIIVPLWVTIAIIRAVVNLIDKTFNFMPAVLQPKTYVQFTGVEILIAIAIIMLVGILASNYLGKKFLSHGEILLAKIPIIKTIYQGVKYLTAGIIGEKKIFSRVVLLEFPRKGLSSIGFVTGEAKQVLPEQSDKKFLKIFIPTTPNPTTGFFVIVAEDEVKAIDLNVEEAFKLIISAGFADVKISDSVMRKGPGE